MLSGAKCICLACIGLRWFFYGLYPGIHHHFSPPFWKPLGCPWKLVTILSKLGCFTYLGDVYPTYLYRGELIYLLSTSRTPGCMSYFPASKTHGFSLWDVIWSEGESFFKPTNPPFCKFSANVYNKFTENRRMYMYNFIHMYKILGFLLPLSNKGKVNRPKHVTNSGGDWHAGRIVLMYTHLGGPQKRYPWYLLCSLGILGGYNP